MQSGIIQVKLESINWIGTFGNHSLTHGCESSGSEPCNDLTDLNVVDRFSGPCLDDVQYGKELKKCYDAYECWEWVSVDERD